MIGTLHYMAPERFSTADVDARADIYALACVLYECLTGRRPYPGDRVEQQLAAHLSEPPPRPSGARPEVPAEFDAVIAKGMAKTPNDRYATTVDLARAASEAITTPIPRPAVAPPTQPAWTPDIPGAVTEPLPPSPGVAFSSAETRQRPPDLTRRAAAQKSAVERVVAGSQKPPSSRRLRRIIIAAVVLVLLLVIGLFVGGMIIRNHYYVAVHDGTVSVMRGYQASLLGYPLQQQSRIGCINNQNELSIFDVGQQPDGCRQLRVDDLNQTGRTQIAGLPGGSLDDATEQMRKLVEQSLLQVCKPSGPRPGASTAPPPGTTPAPSPSLTTPAPTPGTVTLLPPAPQEPGKDCRIAA